MKITLGQAAKQAGISKSYLSKLIKTGKISAERQPNGEFRIDPSELDRLSHIRRANTQQKTDGHSPKTDGHSSSTPGRMAERTRGAPGARQRPQRSSERSPRTA